jgi:hypothetical protein
MTTAKPLDQTGAVSKANHQPNPQALTQAFDREHPWDESTYTVTSNIPESAAVIGPPGASGDAARMLTNKNGHYDSVEGFEIQIPKGGPKYIVISGTADNVYDVAIFDKKTGAEIAFHDYMGSDAWTWKGQTKRSEPASASDKAPPPSKALMAQLPSQVKRLEHWINMELKSRDVGIDENSIAGTDDRQKTAPDGTPANVTDLYKKWSADLPQGSSAVLYKFNLQQVNPRLPNVEMYGVEKYAKNGSSSSDVMILFARERTGWVEVATGKDDDNGLYAWTKKA